jgi:hypothetical protein
MEPTGRANALDDELHILHRPFRKADYATLICPTGYSDDGAEFEATALAGKQSFRFKSIYRLLFAD